MSVDINVDARHSLIFVRTILGAFSFSFVLVDIVYISSSSGQKGDWQVSNRLPLIGVPSIGPGVSPSAPHLASLSIPAHMGYPGSDLSSLVGGGVDGLTMIHHPPRSAQPSSESSSSSPIARERSDMDEAEAEAEVAACPPVRHHENRHPPSPMEAPVQMTGGLPPATTASPSSSPHRRTSSVITGRSMPSTLHQRRRLPVPLPAFDFNPGGERSPSEAGSSPSASSPSPTSPSSAAGLGRPRRHRREVSHFIGRDGPVRSPVWMSPGPGRVDAIAGAGAGAGRRGHHHRRSGAISCHDVSSIIRPTLVPAGVAHAESAPTSPMEDGRHHPIDVAVDHRPTLTADGLVHPRPPIARPPGRATGGGGDAPRARVGFSDDVEFIPRPLSTLSSETSSSQTTVRDVHSWNETISSLVGPESIVPAHNPLVTAPPLPDGTSTSPRAESDRSPLLITTTTTTPRPGRRHRTRPDRLASVPTESSSWPTDSRRSSVLSSSGSARHLAPLMSPSADGGAALARRPSTGNHPDRTRSGKVVKRQHQTPSWSASILFRRSRGVEGHARRGRVESEFVSESRSEPTSTTTSSSSSSSSSSFSSPTLPESSGIMHLDRDDTCTIISNEFPYVPPSFGPPPSPKRSTRPIIDTTGPLIDLDAALGPFQTPGLGQGSTEAALATRRRMHSGSSTAAVITGPGLNHHLRTESAPQLVAVVDLGRSSLHRWTSRSTMADVFEEDEEDDDEPVVGSTTDRPSMAGPFMGKSGLEHTSTGSRIVDGVDLGSVEDHLETSGAVVNERTRKPVTTLVDEVTHPHHGHVATEEGGGGDDGIAPPTIHPAAPPDSPMTHPIKEEGRCPTTSVPSARSSPSPTLPPATTTSTTTGREEVRRPSWSTGPSTRESPFLPRPRSTPATPSLTYSTTASPELVASSFERASLTTASVLTSTSSVDDRPLYSPLPTELSLSVRVSVDDVPSLASTNSTRTSAVQSFAVPPEVISRPRSHEGLGPGVMVRSDSLTSNATGQSGRTGPAPLPTKPSSFGSLSRLMSGSHLERSKLSIEQLPQQPDSEKGKKSRKGRGGGIGRLMRLWRSKPSIE